MRLSVSDSKGAQRDQMVSLASNMSDLGYYVRLGKQISAVPDAEYPWDPAIVRKIRAEFDPAWTPLFCRELWQSPGTHGHVVTGRHMVGRHVSIPKSELDVLSVLRPSHSYGGITIKAPIIESMTLETRLHDGSCECDSCAVERSSGGLVRRDLGSYVPFDDRVYFTCKAIWQQNHSKKAKQIAKEIAYLQVDKPQEEIKAHFEGLRQNLKDDWSRMERIRKSETDYDRMKAAEPRAPKPMVAVGKAAGHVAVGNA